MIKHSVFKYDFVIVSLRRVAPNTNEQRSRSGLCERVIRREATETEGLVLYNYRLGRSTDSNLLLIQEAWAESPRASCKERSEADQLVLII